jgi:hypothetical protein
MPCLCTPRNPPEISSSLPKNYFTVRKNSLILSDKTIARLRKIDPLLVGEAKDGKQIISLGLIASSSHSPRPVLSTDTSSNPASCITIPTHSESIATFEFLGYTPQKAANLWEQRMSHIQRVEAIYPSSDGFGDQPTDVQSWATDHDHVGICGQDACADSTDDWDGAMAKIGINDKIRAALAKPEHSNIRLTQNMSEWLREIINANFWALVFLEDRILLELDRATADVEVENNEEATCVIPPIPDGHIALYKSVEYRKNMKIPTPDDLLYRYWACSRMDIGDNYFAEQRWVAEQYSALISDACPIADRRTLEVHVPLSYFQSVGLWELKFEDEEFKKQACYFRNRGGHHLGQELWKKRGEYGAISGPMLCNHNLSFKKMKSWREITEEHQLRSKGDPTDIAKQYCWPEDLLLYDLEDAVQGKMYVRQA